MTEATVGEIRLFPYGQGIPNGWLPCEGQVLLIKDYAALYSLLNTQYGGDGRLNFALPDLRGRTPVQFGIPPDQNRIWQSPTNVGTKAGAEGITLTAAQLPAHTHSFGANPENATLITIAGAVPSTSTKPANASATAAPAPNIYAPLTSSATAVALNAQFIGNAGSSQAHENRQPYLALRYAICANGYYPQRS